MTDAQKFEWLEWANEASLLVKQRISSNHYAWISSKHYAWLSDGIVYGSMIDGKVSVKEKIQLLLQKEIEEQKLDFTVASHQLESKQVCIFDGQITSKHKCIGDCIGETVTEAFMAAARQALSYRFGIDS
jgi:hypothetical protein